MRRGAVISIVLGLSVLVSCADAGTPVPNWLPGLVRIDAPWTANCAPSPGQAPTPNDCAKAWNGGAPFAARMALVELDPISAWIRVGTVSIPADLASKIIGRPSHRLSGPACAIDFVLPNLRLLFISGAWRIGRVPVWVEDAPVSFLPPGSGTGCADSYISTPNVPCAVSYALDRARSNAAVLHRNGSVLMH